MLRTRTMPNTVLGPSMKAFSRLIFWARTVSRKVELPPGWVNMGTSEVVAEVMAELTVTVAGCGNLEAVTTGDPTSISERLTSRSA